MDFQLPEHLAGTEVLLQVIICYVDLVAFFSVILFSLYALIASLPAVGVHYHQQLHAIRIPRVLQWRQLDVSGPSWCVCCHCRRHDHRHYRRLRTVIIKISIIQNLTRLVRFLCLLSLLIGICAKPDNGQCTQRTLLEIMVLPLRALRWPPHRLLVSGVIQCGFHCLV
jgi:hypothetical protein